VRIRSNGGPFQTLPAAIVEPETGLLQRMRRYEATLDNLLLFRNLVLPTKKVRQALSWLLHGKRAPALPRKIFIFIPFGVILW
jgi:hypothetical protein